MHVFTPINEAIHHSSLVPVVLWRRVIMFGMTLCTEMTRKSDANCTARIDREYDIRGC